MVAILVGAFLLFSRKDKKMDKYPLVVEGDWVRFDEEEVNFDPGLDIVLTPSLETYPTTGNLTRIPTWELAAEKVVRWYEAAHVTVSDILFVRTQFQQDPNAMFDKLFPGFQRILPTLRRSDYIDDTGFPSMALLKAAWPRILRAHADDRRESWDPVPDLSND